MNFLEGYWDRKDKINTILSGLHFENEHLRESTVSAWAHSNLTLEQIENLIKNTSIDKPMEHKPIKFKDVEDYESFELRPGPGVLTK